MHGEHDQAAALRLLVIGEADTCLLLAGLDCGRYCRWSRPFEKRSYRTSNYRLAMRSITSRRWEAVSRVRRKRLLASFAGVALRLLRLRLL